MLQGDDTLNPVILGLDPRIQGKWLKSLRLWITGSSPAMTKSIALLMGAQLVAGCALLAPKTKVIPPVAPAPPQHTVQGDPPVVPYKETVISDDGSFEKACLAPLKTMPERLAWIWGDKLLTRDRSNGFIWRADYSTPRDRNHAHYNRLICSVLPNGGLNIQIALDQPVERLSVAAGELGAPNTADPK